MSQSNTYTPFALMALAVLFRWLVAQFPYSGQGVSPMYGDYEAQRHWMEITNNIPVEEWYQNTTDNNLLYWGLDYPPLTAYHMYVLGFASKRLINESWTELHKSRGIENQDHKLFMRSTVLVSDVLFYIPAVIYYFQKSQPLCPLTYSHPTSKNIAAIFSALTLLYPGQILIDHGHFQYNCVFLGLVLWAIIFMEKRMQASAALFFTLALCYKQMSLYYSLPFFWYIASYNLRVRPIWKGLRNLIMIGFLVLSTVALIFLPFLYSKDSILQVVARIFPFYRGVFEDKVANFWYNLSIFYKYRHQFKLEDLIKASTCLTLLASLPAGIHLLISPSIRTFKYALVTTSTVFFLFSFQVHEKTILVPALPVLLLYREHPIAVTWFSIISSFSLQPLLIRDGQTIPYLVLMIIFALMTLETFRDSLALNFQQLITIRNLFIVLYLSSILGCAILSVLALQLEPPARYPDIHPTLNALYSFIHLMAFLVYFYFREFVPEVKRPNITSRIILKKTK